MHAETHFDGISLHIPTIHRLDLGRIGANSFSKEELTTDRILQLVKRLVHIYNARLGNKSRFYRFKELSLGDRLNQGVDNCQFRLWCVWRRIIYPSTGLTPLLKAMEAKGDFSGSSCEIVLFFYRLNSHGEGDAFALAEGLTAWHLFASYRDAFFARMVSKQMMAFPVSSVKSRPMMGSKTQRESKHDGTYHIWENKYCLEWIEKLTAATKEEAFPKTMPRLQKDLPLLSMQEKALTLHSSLNLDEWFLFLDHLSATYHESLGQLFEEKNAQFAFLTDLQQVDDSVVPGLKQALGRELWRIFCSVGHVETTLRFAPLQNNEYCQADHFSFSKDMESSWTQRLSSVDLIRQLAKGPMKGVADKLKKARSQQEIEVLSEEFLKKMATVRLYHSKGKRTHSSLLLDGMEGEVILSSTREHFFHIKQRWVQPRFDFFANLDRDFTKLLQDSLLKEGHPLFEAAHLPKPWLGHELAASSSENGSKQREDVEGKYNLSYKDEKNWVVGDKACPRGVEIFDLFYHDAVHQKLYLYQVKEKFGGGARAAAFQLMNAADTISAFINGDLVILDEWESELKSHNSEAHASFIKWGGLKKLREVIQKTSRKNIVFVYAMAESSGRYLDDELQLIRSFGENDFSVMVEKLGRKGYTTKALQKEFLKQRMIDRFARLTRKGLACFERGGKDHFIDSMKATLGEEGATLLYDYLKPLVGTKFNSCIPRFAIIKAARHIQRHFTFVIDQITPQSDSLSLTDALGSSLLLEDLAVSESQEWASGATIMSDGEGSYVLQETLDEGIAPLHAVLGDWNSEERAFGWELERAREKFADEVRKRLKEEEQAESTSTDDFSLRQRVRSVVQQLVHYNVPTQGKSLPDNAKEFWEHLDSSSSKSFRKYVKGRRAWQKTYHQYDNQKAEELDILKKCLGVWKEVAKGRAGEHPNRFVALLSGNKESLNQIKRIEIIKKYENNLNVLDVDYKKNRSDLVDYLLKRKSANRDDSQLKMLYEAEEELKRLENEFDQAKPVDVYVNSLSMDRTYGLEEAMVALHIAPRKVCIYATDSADAASYQHWKNRPDDEDPERIVFMSVDKTRRQFFVCVPEGEVPSGTFLDKEISDHEDEDIDALRSPTLTSGLVESYSTGSLSSELLDEADSVAPLPSWMCLENIGNSCYLDTALQALFASEVIVCSLRSSERVTVRNGNIHKALLELCNGRVADQRRLKKAIFTSWSQDDGSKKYLHPEFDSKSADLQLDAASIMELLSEQFLPPFSMLEYRTVASLPGLEFPSEATPPYHVLQVPLNRATSLGEAVQNIFSDSQQGWKCDPSEGIRSKINGKFIITEEQAEKLREQPEFIPERFSNCLRFQSMPEVLIIHLKRFQELGIKLFQPIKFDHDGLLYLSQDRVITSEDYSTTAGLKAKYRLKSYVTHKGDSLKEGHYLAYLEQEGKYYKCDDRKDRPKETSQSVFLGRVDAYLVVLEKIPE